MTTPEYSSLGKPTVYAGHYAPGLLFPIARAPNRVAIGVTEPLPFFGADLWNAYELSWLDVRGKPHVALGEFRIPATSPHIIESKSFKLYLNGFAGERLSYEDLKERLRRDLSAAAGTAVDVRLDGADGFADQYLQELAGDCIDTLDIDIDHYGPPHAGYLVLADSNSEVEETLVSHLLKSNCPVTGQPDWASVQIAYRGPAIDHAGLLRYLVSFREHAEFHEQCVERIFMDLSDRCAPMQLSVYARYTRRGGLDINPFRSSHARADIGNPRGARQ